MPCKALKEPFKVLKGLIDPHRDGCFEALFSIPPNLKHFLQLFPLSVGEALGSLRMNLNGLI